MPSLNVRVAPRPPRRLRPFAVVVLSGLSLAVASPVAQTQGVSTERIVDSDQYAAYIVEAAKRVGIPETWIRAVMRVESAGQLRALSAKVPWD